MKQERVGFTKAELLQQKLDMFRDAENLFRSMASECPTCRIPHYRCPECWAHTAKIYLKRIEQIHKLERANGRPLIPPEPPAHAQRSARVNYLVAVLRAAGCPVPASDIRIPGIDHPKSLLKFLTWAVSNGFVERRRKRDAETARTIYVYFINK